MEAVAIVEGLKCALYHEWSSIVIESDCKQVVDNQSRKVNDLSELRMIYANIRELKSQFSYCYIAYVSRKANFATHRLARWA